MINYHNKNPQEVTPSNSLHKTVCYRHLWSKHKFLLLGPLLWLFNRGSLINWGNTQICLVTRAIIIFNSLHFFRNLPKNDSSEAKNLPYESLTMVDDQSRFRVFNERKWTSEFIFNLILLEIDQIDSSCLIQSKDKSFGRWNKHAFNSIGWEFDWLNCHVALFKCFID